MGPSDVYRRIKPVDIGGILEVIGALEFADSGNKCALVTKPGSAAPEPLLNMVRGLELGGTFKRMFCRKLNPYQGIDAHIDDWILPEWNLRRFQVPLTSHPDIIMRWPDDEIEVHLEPGYLYEVRYDRMHEVVNKTPHARIHIQIDQLNATIQ